MRGSLEVQKEVNKGSLHLIINVAAATCSHRIETGSCVMLGLHTSTPSHNMSLLLLGGQSVLHKAEEQTIMAQSTADHLP